MDIFVDLNDLDTLIEKLSEQSLCFNGTVIHHIRSSLKTLKTRKKTIPYTNIAKLLIEKFSLPVQTVSLIAQIRSTYNRYLSLNKNKGRDWQELKSFLCTTFVINNDNSLDSTSGVPPTNSPPHPPTTTTSPPHPPTTATTPPRLSTPPPQCPESKLISTPIKTRRDCFNCSSAKKVNISLTRSVKAHKQTLHKYKKSAAAIKKELNLRTKNQKIKRYSQKIDELKQVIKSYEIKLCYRTKKNISFASTVKELQNDNECLKSENKHLKDSIKDLSSKLIENQKYLDYITSIECDNDSDCETIDTKCGKEYSEKVRRCVYHQLVRDVPVNSCGDLIHKIINILVRKELVKVPSPASCSQMAYELGVLSSIHLIEFMLGQKDLCLSWDATTIEGAHVNEIHLTANKVQCLILDVRHLPGGKSSDYVTHIISALSDAADLYASFHGLPAIQTLSDLKSSISCTLTDRAAVNAVVTRELCSELENQLLLLNCNIHPLDSVARDAKKALIKFDAEHNIKGNCYGCEGVAANLIKAISILRYKDGKGDPVGFMSFLHQHNIPVGTFPRYVGNRLHVIFHLAGLIILYVNQLQSFTQDQCTAAGLLRSSILKDLNDEKIMVQVWALAVLGKIFSGPWMTKFYSSTMSNLEMGSFIQTCMAQLNTWIADVGVLFEPQFNVFGETLDREADNVLVSICNYTSGDEDVQRRVLECVLLSTQGVLSRQLKDFLDGGQYTNPSKDVMEQAASAPTHNISSERALGSLDRLWRRAPNATMGFLSGKVRCKMNKTLEWLDNKPPTERTSLISFAVRHAQRDRSKKALDSVNTKKVIAERRVEVASQRESAKKRSIVRELNKIFTNKKNVSDLICNDNVALQHIKTYISTPESVTGCLLFYCHRQMYARIQNIRKKNNLVVSFWNFGESESTSVDFKISASTLYADIIMGNTLFM